MRILINNVRNAENYNDVSQIEIENSVIKNVCYGLNNFIENTGAIKLDFSNALAFPGLINSHDHLEFNLFPKLGSRFYKNYVEWGDDIHSLFQDKIERVKKIPYELRFKWGLYKNLICGVATVVHHGNGAVFNFRHLPVVYTGFNYLHSIRLEKKWKIKLNTFFNDLPVAVHIGEGIDNESEREIDKLINWNIFRKKLVGVHAISLKERQCRNFRAIVWCPDSNLFLYNQTADIQTLKKQTKILFGTDSALSADWNIWNQLRLARKLNLLTDEELYNSLTETASDIWRLNLAGKISTNKKADIVVAKKKSDYYWKSFYSINPEDILLIIKNGEIVFIDEELQNEQRAITEKDFDLVSINSVRKYITAGICNLMLSIQNYIPEYNFPVKPVKKF